MDEHVQDDGRKSCFQETAFEERVRKNEEIGLASLTQAGLTRTNQSSHSVGHRSNFGAANPRYVAAAHWHGYVV